MKTSQIAWLVGLTTAITSALLGQAELLGEPWRHVVTVASVIATAVSGYMLQRPSPWDGSERRARADYVTTGTRTDMVYTDTTDTHFYPPWSKS